MPLSNDAQYGVHPMTEAINRLPVSSTIIRSLGVFKPDYKTTTYVTVEERNGELTLVTAVPRGSSGEPVRQSAGQSQTFEMLHLPKKEIVRADDVQNVRAFGSDNKAMTVAELVADKLELMKSDTEYTREHLMLGALKGKILNADGTELVDIYKRFGLTRQEFTWNLSSDRTVVGKEIDTTKTAQGKNLRGESLKGWIVLCSEQFMQALIYHKSVYELYVRYQDGAVLRDGDTNISFRYKNINFIQYDHEFESGEKIPDGEAIILPDGSRKAMREFFAPADMSTTINTKAKPFYASREKLDHDAGWELKTQSNPLPLLLRPDLVATLKMS